MKTLNVLCFFVTLVLSTTLPVSAQSDAGRSEDHSAALTAHRPKILIMVPNNFKWPEYADPRRIYEEGGLEVVVATIDGREATPDPRDFDTYEGVGAAHASLSFQQVVVDDYDAITTVGGNGAWEDFMPNKEAHRVIREALAKNKTTGLICASTGILAVLDNFDGSRDPIVKGRKVTGYYKVEAMLRELGEVNFVDGDPTEITVVSCGNLITGRNPESSILFGEKVLQAVTKK